MSLIDILWDNLIEPIKNAISQLISPFTDYVLNIITTIVDFVNSIVSLGSTISSFIVGLLYDIFLTNPYASATFSIITILISLVIFMRVYNIFAGMTLFGFKIPRI